MSEQDERAEMDYRADDDPHFGSTLPTPSSSKGRACALPLEEAIHSASRENLVSAAADSALTADLALALLQRADLPADVIEELSKNRSLLRQRKVKIALASHPQAPRHVSVPLIRQFYTFDLMKVALSPVVAADLKRIADETLIARLKTVTQGERLTLARQASGRMAGVLLLDLEERILRAALENARLTEALVVQAVLRPEASGALIQAVSQHAKWSYRRDVQIALLRTEFLSLAQALVFARAIPPVKLREIVHSSRLPEKIKEQLMSDKLSASAKVFDET